MSYWMCCNSCFLSPSAERGLAVTTCGHVICNVCFQKGKQGVCFICNASCQVSPLSSNSSPEVKALFTDINIVATKHFKEISKVIMFQARHQKGLLTHYQQKSEKLEEVLVKMKQEMQQMTKKLNEQSAYIAKLERQSAKVSSVHQKGHTPIQGQNIVRQIPYSSPMSLSRHSSATNIIENMEVDDRSLYRKRSTVPRLSLISPPQDAQMGIVPQRSTSQLAKHSARSATVSRFQAAAQTPDLSFSQTSTWTSPVFKAPSSFRHSMSSLVHHPPGH